jgi:hypothetical protein
VVVVVVDRELLVPAVLELQIKDMVAVLVRKDLNMALVVVVAQALLVEMELQLTAATAATVFPQTSVAPL